MKYMGVGYESVLSLPIIKGLIGNTKEQQESEFIQRVRAILVNIFVLFVRSENDLLHTGR